MKFTDYQKMIQKVAHVMSERYNVEYEDMEAQGYLIYCECVQRFDLTKSSFSTYLYINLSGRLSDYGVTNTRQRGINLYDMINYEYSEEEDVDECNCLLLAMDDNDILRLDLMESAKHSLSTDGFTVFKWILGRTWEKRGRRIPTITNAVEALGWTREHMRDCWNECRSFWLNEGAAYCC